MRPFPPNRLLVLRGGALGDFLVTGATLRALRTAFPSARIELAGNPRAADLGILAGWIDAVHDQSSFRWTPLFLRKPLPYELASFLRTFDIILCYWPDPDSTVTENLTKLGFDPTGSARRLLVTGSPQPESGPAAAHFANPLTRLGVRPGPLLAPIGILKYTRSKTTRKHSLTSPFFVWHPGSGSPRKNPPAKWWRLVWSLCGDDFREPIVVMPGEADHKVVSDIPAILETRPHRVIPGLALRDLAAILAEATYYIGLDSGVTHLAAAVGIRGLAVFGPTDPEIWAPPTKRIKVIQSPDWNRDSATKTATFIRSAAGPPFRQAQAVSTDSRSRAESREP